MWRAPGDFEGLPARPQIDPGRRRGARQPDTLRPIPLRPNLVFRRRSFFYGWVVVAVAALVVLAMAGVRSAPGALRRLSGGRLDRDLRRVHGPPNRARDARSTGAGASRLMQLGR